MEEPGPSSVPAAQLKRWQMALMVAAVALLIAEIVFPIATWPVHLVSTAFYLYKLAWLTVLVIACGFWTALFRFARTAGGAGYAAGYVFLSVFLTPFLLAGIFVVPTLVERDIEGGQAAWRRQRALSLHERALRTLLYFAALLVVAAPLWWLGRDFLIAAPVLAIFLQRLVLPWCRRAGPGAEDGIVS